MNSKNGAAKQFASSKGEEHQVDKNRRHFHFVNAIIAKCLNQCGEIRKLREENDILKQQSQRLHHQLDSLQEEKNRSPQPTITDRECGPNDVRGDLEGSILDGFDKLLNTHCTNLCNIMDKTTMTHMKLTNVLETAQDRLNHPSNGNNVTVDRVTDKASIVDTSSASASSSSSSSDEGESTGNASSSFML